MDSVSWKLNNGCSFVIEVIAYKEMNVNEWINEITKLQLQSQFI